MSWIAHSGAVSSETVHDKVLLVLSYALEQRQADGALTNVVGARELPRRVAPALAIKSGHRDVICANRGFDAFLAHRGNDVVATAGSERRNLNHIRLVDMERVEQRKWLPNAA